MSLFKKKDKAAEGVDDLKETKHDHDLDFLIHNMPKPDAAIAKAGRGESIAVNTPGSRSALPPANSNSSYKKIGLVIISAGIILIMVLAYIAYRLLFGNNNPASPAPVATSTPSQLEATNGENATPSSSVIVDIASTSEDIATSTDSEVSLIGQPVIASSSFIGTETASSSDILATSTVIAAAGVKADSDNDGLNDISEASFGTNQYMIDTDGDGYSDLQEIENGYNPAGNGKTEESEFVSKYDNISYGYSLAYPAVWGQKNIGGDYFSVFNVPDGSLVQISVQENSRSQDIISWYRQEFSFFDTFDNNRLVRAYDGNQGIYSADGMTIYFTDSLRRNIYIVSFVPVSDGQTDYFQVFQIMAAGLKME